ncbi:MAG: sigma-70 family polymerase sigma factor [Dehalococcoidia bacterium]|nr:sigma-70 family polymerase sigma factor [Dehalococcoidia bacterium]
MTEINDLALMEAIAQRDEAALGALYDRYARLSFSIAVRVVGDDSAAEDVVQEAYLKVWRMALTYAPNRGTVKAWVMSVVYHQAIDLCRGRRATVPLEPTGEHTFLEPVAPENVWDSVSAKIDRDTLQRAMEAIPLEQRRMIELAWDGEA